MAETQDKAAEEGELSKSQSQEITEGRFFSIKQLAEELSYSTEWITRLVKRGRIKGIKPTGFSWRIPASEVDRIKKEGIPPLLQKPPSPTPGEIEVPPEHRDRVEAKPKEKKEEPGKEDKGRWPFNIFFKD